MNYENLPQEMEQYKAMMPSESILYIKDNKSRSEQDAGMGGTQMVISDSKKKTAVVLIDIMGQKVMQKKNKKDIEEKEKNQPEPEITYLDETKEIAGYECKKAEVKFEDNEGTFTYYYTEEIAHKGNKQVKGLKGFPLEYQINQNGIIITVTATEVKKEKVPESLFEIPEGYQEVTDEQMQQMFGGGGQ